MNFELYDNAFQILVLGTAALISFALSIYCHARSFLIMAFAYACFMMGTLFYTLHLAIIGDIPRIFYVAEISWMASYLFYLSLQIFRTETLKIRFHISSAIAAVLTSWHVVWWQIFGPFACFIVLLALTAGAIVYLSVFRMMVRKKYDRIDMCLILIVVLQIALYIVSAFMETFTRFNLYFAVDITLTMTMAMLIPLMYREVKKQ